MANFPLCLVLLPTLVKAPPFLAAVNLSTIHSTSDVSHPLSLSPQPGNTSPSPPVSCLPSLLSPWNFISPHLLLQLALAFLHFFPSFPHLYQRFPSPIPPLTFPYLKKTATLAKPFHAFLSNIHIPSFYPSLSPFFLPWYILYILSAFIPIPFYISSSKHSFLHLPPFLSFSLSLSLAPSLSLCL